MYDNLNNFKNTAVYDVKILQNLFKYTRLLNQIKDSKENV